MLVSGIPADDVTTWRSQETNTRLCTIVEQLVAGFSEFDPGTELRARSIICC